MIDRGQGPIGMEHLEHLSILEPVTAFAPAPHMSFLQSLLGKRMLGFWQGLTQLGRRSEARLHDAHPSPFAFVTRCRMLCCLLKLWIQMTVDHSRSRASCREEGGGASNSKFGNRFLLATSALSVFHPPGLTVLPWMPQTNAVLFYILLFLEINTYYIEFIH